MTLTINACGAHTTILGWLGSGDESQACAFVISIKITANWLAILISLGSNKLCITVTPVGNGLEFIKRNAFII
jgi:hypothetical protein